MKAKEYLLQVSKIDKLITNKLIEKEQWRSIATGTTASSDGERVQSSGSQQKMADAVHKMLEIEEEINRYIDKLIDTKLDVVHTIEQLPHTEYDICHKMYIGIFEEGSNTTYLNCYEVADLYNKSYSWSKKVHGRALKKIQAIIDNKEKQDGELNEDYK